MAKKPVKKSAPKAKKSAHKPATKKVAHPPKAAPKKAAAHHKPAKKAHPVKVKKAGAQHKPAKAPAKKVAAKAAHPSPKAPAPAAKKSHDKHLHAHPPKKPSHPHPEAKPTKKKSKKHEEEPVELEAKGEEQVAAGEDEESDEVVLTDAEGRRYCRVKDCDQVSTVEGYCRYHYLLFWKKIQVRKKILTEGKLERYIEELTARYPDKFLDMLRKDLRSDKEFLAAIAELEIDESATEGEFEDEAQTYIDEVRGMAETPSRDEEDF